MQRKDWKLSDAAAALTVQGRIDTGEAAASVPWDKAPSWARFAFSGSWFLLWLENAPASIFQDEIQVDGRCLQDNSALVHPPAGLVQRPKETE